MVPQRRSRAGRAALHEAAGELSSPGVVVELVPWAENRSWFAHELEEQAGVHPKTTETLARHSTITLVLDRTTHVALGDDVRAIEALPRLGDSDRSPSPTYS